MRSNEVWFVVTLTVLELMFIRTESQVLVLTRFHFWWGLMGTSRMSYLLHKFSHFEENFYSMRSSGI